MVIADRSCKFSEREEQQTVKVERSGKDMRVEDMECAM